MHADSSGHDVSLQPWIVQYPPGCDESHERVPLGLQSAAVVHSSPILRAQPLVAIPTVAKVKRTASIRGKRATVSIRSMAGGRCTANPRAMPRGRRNGRGCFRLTARGTNLVQGAVVRSPPMLTDDPAVLVARANS